MTSEAPERMVVAKCYPFKDPDDFYVCHPQLKHPAGIEYIRADLHQQALEAAEARGYARAVGAVVSRLAERVSDLSGDVDEEVREDRLSGYTEGLLDEAEGLLEEIRALSPTPADPVAEAAKVLAEAPAEDLIAATEAALHDMGVPRPKDSKQHHRAYFLAVCRALAQKEGE